MNQNYYGQSVMAKTAQDNKNLEANFYRLKAENEALKARIAELENGTTNQNVVVETVALVDSADDVKLETVDDVKIETVEPPKEKPKRKRRRRTKD